ncbi:MAG: carbamoyltransferase HypF [archaeon]
MKSQNKPAYFKYIIKGIVQGVGFRPYIYRKAKELCLTGYVKNIGSGVEVVVNDSDFIEKLFDLPPLAKITETFSEKLNLDPCSSIYTEFKILSSSNESGETIIPPDIFMCEDCLKELKDKNNRRNSYYFITCTNCGPRFSMIEDYPYDRPLTSMKEFAMCDLCKREYTNPLDRRYHAQTIACKDCGPRLYLIENEIKKTFHDDKETIRAAASLIHKGEFISIKGVGGFHICAKTGPVTVKKIREFIGRKDKPFAVMVKNIDMAKQLVNISPKEESILLSPQRPIVVANKINKHLLEHVSELDSIGVMLPYTPLHHMLFDFIDEPLVMTSSNISGDPTCLDESFGEFFLSHDRKIVNRCDDSVIKVIGKNDSFLRRSRGYAPLPVSLPLKVEDTLALGAELNNVVCVAKGNRFFFSQYIGNTAKPATFDFMKEAIDRLVILTRLSPKIIAADMHPQFNSSALAKDLSTKYNAKLILIQHHEAHVASVAAEHNLKDYVGIAMDGLGYGRDGKLWGGEVFKVTGSAGFDRLGSLEEQPQIGGDSAAQYPKKMLFGILSNIMNEDALISYGLFPKNESRLYYNMIKENFNCPLTTSAGRVLDAASALLGFCDERTYDGRPAMLLESCACGLPFEIDPVIEFREGKYTLMTSHLFKYLLANLNKDRHRLAATAQHYLANGMFLIAKKISNNSPIVFSGGVAYNKMISEYMLSNGVLLNKEIPAGDGGICYGQAYLANMLANSK